MNCNFRLQYDKCVLCIVNIILALIPYIPLSIIFVFAVDLTKNLKLSSQSTEGQEDQEKHFLSMYFVSVFWKI